MHDFLRVVHDYFGHAKASLGFRAADEENAWRGHATTYTPLAKRALASELQGHSYCFNWGPHGASNRAAGMDDTIFAEQKIELMPGCVAWEGAEDEADVKADDLPDLPA